MIEIPGAFYHICEMEHILSNKKECAPKSSFCDTNFIHDS
jgi:hypothetical protein